jgi:hypothetical protein
MLRRRRHRWNPQQRLQLIQKPPRILSRIRNRTSTHLITSQPPHLYQGTTSVVSLWLAEKWALASQTLLKVRWNQTPEYTADDDREFEIAAGPKTSCAAETSVGFSTIAISVKKTNNQARISTSFRARYNESPVFLY